MSNNTTGSSIPILFNFDVTEVPDVTTPEFKELQVRLYQFINTMAVAINVRDGGYYPQYEYVNGQQFFPNPTINPTIYRSVFRKVINVGALGAGATAVNHNIPITIGYTFTRIYGAASDTVGNNYYPLPFASAGGAANIELRVTATQIIITNNSGIAFNFCYVVVEYMKF